jgi:hypothetical protein
MSKELAHILATSPFVRKIVLTHIDLPRMGSYGGSDYGWSRVQCFHVSRKNGIVSTHPLVGLTNGLFLGFPTNILYTQLSMRVTFFDLIFVLYIQYNLYLKYTKFYNWLSRILSCFIARPV